MSTVEASDVRAKWASRSGEFSPRYYAYYGPDESSERLADALEDNVDPSAAVLELGCSSGRHLKYLHDRGYEDLSGIEINEEAIDVMRETYPDVAEAGAVFADSIESVVSSMDDREYDAVFSVQTLQHIHEDSEWVFDEIRRITDRVLVTVEIEGDRGADEDVSVQSVGDVPITYRNWQRVFEGEGLEQVRVERFENNTLRAFERTDG